MEKEKLIELIKENLSTYKISKFLKLSNSTVTYYVKKYDLELLYKSQNRNYKRSNNNPIWQKKNLLNKIENSVNYSNCIEQLGLVPRGHNYKTLKKYIKEYNIDVSHFNKNIKKVGLRKIKNIEEYLVKNSSIASSALKKKLYKNNLKQRICELCGQNEEWNGSKMSLILDHINGEHTDNRIENLRIVCPNCNATLPTHCGKHRKTKLKDQKEKLIKERLNNSGLTNLELKGHLSRRKPRPSLNELIEDRKTLSFLKIGKKYNVSDNTVRRWLKTN